VGIGQVADAANGYERHRLLPADLRHRAAFIVDGGGVHYLLKLLCFLGRRDEGIACRDHTKKQLKVRNRLDLARQTQQPDISRK